MGPNPEPLKPNNKFHLKPSTSLKVSKYAIFVLFAIISVQTVSSALLWYAGKIKADSGSRVVTALPATDVTTSAASLHARFDYPDGVTSRGFEYGTSTSYGNQVLDTTDPSSYTTAETFSNVQGAWAYTMDAAGNMYRADSDGSSTASINKYDSSGNLIAQYGSYGSGNGQFQQPMDLFVDGSGNIYVADLATYRVQKLDSSGNYVSQFPLAEQSSGTPFGASAITVDGLGNIYVVGQWDADPAPGIFNIDRQPLVQEYSSAGVLQSQLISSSGTGTNQLATWAEWQYLATDTSNNLYITDPSNMRVLIYDTNANFVDQWDVDINPTHIYVSADGHAYVTSGGFYVWVYDANGNLVRDWQVADGAGYLGGVYADSNGTIWAPLAGGPGVAGYVYKGQPAINAALDALQCDTTYHYRAFVVDADSTDYSSDSTFTTEPCTGLRTLTALPADNITRTGATLHGTTDYPQGITSRGFQYGLTTSYGSSAVDSSAMSPVDGVAGIDKAVSGLACSTLYHYRVFVIDRGGFQVSSDATFTTDDCVPVHISTTNLDDGAVGVSYQDNIAVDENSGTVTYSISSGSLPPGLSLDTNTGYITGIPEAIGTYGFDVTATDGHTSDTASLSILVNETAPLSITTEVLPDTQVGASYQEYIYTANHLGDVAFSVVTGALPDGLTLVGAGSTGILYGTPTSAGTYTFMVEAQDTRGANPGGTTSQEYTIVVTAPQLNITTANLPFGRVGLQYSKTIEYEGAASQPVFTVVSGSLPSGMSLSLQGYLQGTPTQAGTYNFTVQADDGFSSDTQAFTLVVGQAVVYDNSPFVTITSPINGASFGGGASTVTGTGPANKVISIFVDGTQVGTTTANAQGTWTYEVSGVAVGNHNLVARWVPGSDVAFIPWLDSSGNTAVQVIDNSSASVLRTIRINSASQPPFVAFGATLNNSGTKLYIFGYNANGVQAVVRELDLNTMSQRTLTVPPQTNSFALGLSITPDDNFAVLTEQSNSAGSMLRKLNLSTFSLEGSEAILPGSNVYGLTNGALNEDATKFYTSFGAEVNTVLEYTLATGAVRTINVSGNTMVGTTTYRAGKLYYLAKDVEGHELVLKVLDASSGLELNSISVMAFPDPYEDIFYPFTLDASASYAYIAVMPSIGKFAVVNLGTNQVELHDGINGLPTGLGISSNPERVYIPLLSFSDSSSALVWNVQAGAFLEPTSPLMPLATGSYAYGSRVVGAITSPQAGIAFIVPASPADCTVTNTCPSVPCATTNTCPTTPPTVEPPTATTIQPTSGKSPRIITTQYTPTSPNKVSLNWFDRGILAVAHFVPRQAAIGFPYLLFLLLLIFALSLYYQSNNEIRKDKLNREFIAKRKSIRAQQDNFIALASHYLNTPITIIQNGIEVLGDSSRGSKPK